MRAGERLFKKYVAAESFIMSYVCKHTIVDGQVFKGQYFVFTGYSARRIV